MTLDKKQLKHLKSLCHALQPVVRIGQKGVTAAVEAELDGALSHHELVKIKVGLGDREARTVATEQLATKTGAQLIQKIGQTAVLFRRNTRSPVILFPKH